MSTPYNKWPEVPASVTPDVPYYVNALARAIDVDVQELNVITADLNPRVTALATEVNGLEDAAENVETRLNAVEVLGKLTPGNVSDATMTSIAADPASLFAKSQASKFNPRPNLISRLASSTPNVIAHRGGRALYPEQSLEGMRAAADAGFLPECDVKTLMDGTLVTLHDDTVDRTMTGQTGGPGALTRAQWRAMKLRPAIKGGKTARTYLFDELLDELGGRCVLVPELKDISAQADVIAAIKSRGLERSVIVQSFNFDACKALAAAGLESLFLFGGSTTYTPAAIKAAGINFVGPSTSASNSTIAAMKAAGLTVWVYTVNTPADYASKLAAGADGVFSDDPGYVSGLYDIRTSDPYGDGVGWPGIRGHSEVSNVVSTVPVEISGGAIQFNPVVPSSNDVQVVYQDWAGPILSPVEISYRVEFSSDGPSQTLGMGMVLYNNTTTPGADWKDGALAGQNGFTVTTRRNGNVAAWSYTNGGNSVSIFSSASPYPFEFAPAGLPGALDVVVTVTPTALTVEIPTYKLKYTGAHTLNPSVPMRFALRGQNSMTSRVSAVRVRKL